MTQPTADDPDPGRALHARLQADLRPAMKSRDRARVRAIRSMMSAIDNAEAVDVTDPRGPEDPAIGLGAAESARRALDDARLAHLLDRELAERVEAADGRRALGLADDASDLDAEASVIRTYRDGLTR